MKWLLYVKGIMPDIEAEKYAAQYGIIEILQWLYDVKAPHDPNILFCIKKSQPGNTPAIECIYI